MSALTGETSDEPTPLIKVLFALYPGFDTLDLTGPLEVLSFARHNVKDPGKSQSFLQSVSSVLVFTSLFSHR
jgi:hypothetical protein